MLAVAMLSSTAFSPIRCQTISRFTHLACPNSIRRGNFQQWSYSPRTISERSAKLQKCGPYQLCGHSFGGLVAYEVACLLMSEGESVSLLALIDTRHPASSRNLPIAATVEFYVAYMTDRFVKYGRNLRHAEIKQIAADAFKSIGHRLTKLTWRATRLVSSAPPVAISRRNSQRGSGPT